MSHYLPIFSILGPRYTHGHVYDFVKQLLIDGTRLEFGCGKQRKSYLHVEDCVDAMFFALSHSDKKVNIYNLGTNEYCKYRNPLAIYANKC